jgi:hypothetical protein
MSGLDRDDEFEAFLKRRSPLHRRLSDIDDVEPPDELDRLVLNRAREAIQTPANPPIYRATRWAMPVGLAATILIAFAVVLNVDPSDLGLAQKPATGASGPASLGVESDAALAARSVPMPAAVLEASEAIAAEPGAATQADVNAATRADASARVSGNAQLARARDTLADRPAGAAAERKADLAPPRAISGAARAADEAPRETRELAKSEALVANARGGEAASGFAVPPAAPPTPLAPPDDTANNLEAVVVSGARLRSRDFASASSVTAVDAAADDEAPGEEPPAAASSASSREEKAATDRPVPAAPAPYTDAESWLREIDRLRAAGKVVEADRQLEAFRRAYPAHSGHSGASVAQPPVQ